MLEYYAKHFESGWHLVLKAQAELSTGNNKLFKG